MRLKKNNDPKSLWQVLVKRWLPLLLIFLVLVLIFSTGLQNYLSFESLKTHRNILSEWTNEHFLLSSVMFVAIYTIAVAVSIPGATFLTLAGGFLFGAVFGSILVVISATMGATLLYFAVKTSLGDWLSQKAIGWISRMRDGFQENAFSYLLFLRLVPLFPFWVINIVPALLGVSAATFIVATFFGIMPGSVVYVLVGSGLSHIFATNQTPNLSIIFDPNVLYPLLALAALSLLPVIYQKFFKKAKRDTSMSGNTFDLAIIGAGSGGLSLAAASVQLGLKVALVEGHKMGGDCLNYGCVPSKSLLAAAKSIYQAQHQAPKFGADLELKSLDFSKVMQHVFSVIKTIEPHDSAQRFESLGVKVFQAHGQFLDANTIKAGEQTLKARKMVIATGSSPFVPPIKGIDTTNYLTNETLFDLDALPQHLIVIGGGPIGCELAQAFAMLGSKVTIVEAMTILPKDDEDCVSVVRQSLENMGIELLEGVQVKEVAGKDKSTVEVKITTSKGNKTITGSHLLVATGRRANVENLSLDKAGVSFTQKGIDVNARLQTSQKHIYAIGDVAGPYQFTHMASYQSGIVLRNIAFKWPAKVNYDAVPWVTYTYPELAHVGVLEADIKARSDFIITRRPFSESDRAQTEGETTGLIKVMTDKKGKICGVTIVGIHAGELILPWVMALREGKTLRAFTDTIAPYPTLSEVSKQVSGDFYKPKLFSKKVRTLVSWLQKLWW